MTGEWLSALEILGLWMVVGCCVLVARFRPMRLSDFCRTPHDFFAALVVVLLWPVLVVF